MKKSLRRQFQRHSAMDPLLKAVDPRHPRHPRPTRSSAVPQFDTKRKRPGNRRAFLAS
jgi:hypothetical protein